MKKLNSLIKVALKNSTMISAFYKSRDIANKVFKRMNKTNYIATPKDARVVNRAVNIMNGMKRRGIKG